MVYRKNSRGCLTCRERKILCDEGRPVCKKCQKAKRHCLSGQMKQNIVPDSRPKDVSPPKWPILSSGHSAPFAASSFRRVDGIGYRFTILAPHLCHSATSNTAVIHALSILATTAPCSKLFGGLLSHLPDLFSKADSPVLPAAALTCVHSLCVRATRDHSMFIKATKMHIESLNSLKNAICKPRRARNLETLMAATLLCLNEIICGSETSVAEWTAHIKGLSALIKLWGYDLLQNVIGRTVFRVFRDQWIFSHLTRCNTDIEALDSAMLGACTSSFLSSLEPIPSESVIYTLISNILILASKVKKAESHGSPISISELYRIRDEIMEIEHQLHIWALETPLNWQPSTIVPTQTNVINLKNGTVAHSYCSLHVGRVWNLYRVFRIFANELLIRCVSLYASSVHADPNTIAIANSAKQTIKSLADDVNASTFFFIGDPTGHFKNLELQCRRPVEEADAIIYAGYCIMWPLFVVARANTLDSQLRRLALDRFRYIADDLGIRQAQVLCRMLAASSI